MGCCKKTCPNEENNNCQTRKTGNYAFIVLIIFILLAIVVGSSGF